MKQLQGLFSPHNVRIVGYFVAITTCFCIYSLIQERLMTVPFGEQQEIFKYSVFVVFINRLVTVAVSSSALLWLGSTTEPGAPVALFAIPAIANVVGSTAQYEALKYVSFPLQALAKCAKTVPVMLWNLVTRTRKYSSSDVYSALTVTLGCALFVLTGNIISPTSRMGSQASTALGLALLAAFMIFDGLTSTSQDKLFASYDMHSCNQLMYISIWSAALSSCYLLATAQLQPAVYFVLRHPTAMWLILFQSLISTTVQLFIVFTIKQYGALNFALIMTIRQFLSIVVSCLVFQHDLTVLQWLATIVVIGGLASKSLSKQLKSRIGYSKVSSVNSPKFSPAPSTNGPLLEGTHSVITGGATTAVTPRSISKPMAPV